MGLTEKFKRLYRNFRLRTRQKSWISLNTSSKKLGERIRKKKIIFGAVFHLLLRCAGWKRKAILNTPRLILKQRFHEASWADHLFRFPPTHSLHHKAGLMTLTLKLSPELERYLLQEADQHGLSLEALAVELLTNSILLKQNSPKRSICSNLGLMMRIPKNSRRQVNI